MLKHFDFADCNPSLTPMIEGLKLSQDMQIETVDPALYRSMLGKLIYLTHSRPDISFAVGVVSQYMTNP